jgi:hypothetical protein
MSAVDSRSEYTEQFCKNIRLYGAELDHGKNCAVYIHGANRRSVESQSKSKDQKPQNLTILFVTGIFGQCFENNVVMFSNARNFMRSKKLSGVGTLKFMDAKISGYSSSSVNAQLIKQTIDDLQLSPSERLVVVAYSKGTSDTIETLASFPETAKKVDAFLSVGGVVLGSPLAENKQVFDKLFQSINTRCKGPDGKGVASLKPTSRQNFLRQQKLPDHVNYYSLVGNASRKNTSLILLPLWDMLSRTSSNSDSQVTTDDAVIPGAKVLGYVKADHWAIAMPFITQAPILTKTLITRKKFPREIMLSSAIEMIAADF